MDRGRADGNAEVRDCGRNTSASGPHYFQPYARIPERSKRIGQSKCRGCHRLENDDLHVVIVRTR